MSPEEVRAIKKNAGLAFVQASACAHAQAVDDITKSLITVNEQIDILIRLSYAHKTCMDKTKARMNQYRGVNLKTGMPQINVAKNNRPSGEEYLSLLREYLKQSDHMDTLEDAKVDAMVNLQSLQRALKDLMRSQDDLDRVTSEVCKRTSAM